VSFQTLKKLRVDIILCTVFALLAFAANAIFSRLALASSSTSLTPKAEEPIDVVSFITIRLLSATVVLTIIVLVLAKNKKQVSLSAIAKPAMESKPYNKSKGSWLSALMLFSYALCFSWAYISLDTGTGALVSIGALQLTLLTINLVTGHRLYRCEWLGGTIAFAGFLYLTIPSINLNTENSNSFGFLLMVLAGMSWAVYTYQGKKSQDPLHDTAYNFIRTLPLVILLIIVYYSYSYWNNSLVFSLPLTGVWLAIISGAITSALGYAAWYRALSYLSIPQAAILHLLVPSIAALGGVVFIGESISLRLIISSMMILGGIALSIIGRHHLSRHLRHTNQN